MQSHNMQLQNGPCGGKSNEVRLGLVMYGGVSLAVYINGVACEFFRAVNGQGVYRLVKALTDSDIVVDIISGSSAGGINGIFLARALCGGRDFRDTAALWRKAGGINNLLRDPRDEENSRSLFDSEGYYQRELENAFEHMPKFEPHPEDDPSPLPELDLFVTGTDVYGNIYTDFDDAGHPVDVKDHRTVFLLQHREGRKETFSPPAAEGPDVFRALAKLSRITSCFPAAFEPVHVTLDAPEDRYLRTWGLIGKEAYFLDGGVLDNKPFSYTIRQIYFRTADRRVDRKLFYVEPDPESFQDEKRKEKPDAPNFLQSILKSVMGIPRYESIADDLKAISEHNSKVEQYNRMVKDIPADCGTTSLSMEERQLYERSRLIFLCERVLRGIFKQDGRKQLIVGKNRELAGDLVRTFDRQMWPGDDSNRSEKAGKFFDDLDVYYRLRRLFRVTYLLYDSLYPAEAAAAPDLEKARRYKHLLMVLNRHIRVYEILRSSMEGIIDDADFRWQDKSNEAGAIWTMVRDLLYTLIDVEGKPAATILAQFDAVKRGTEINAEVWLPQDVLAAFNNELKSLSGEILEEPGNRLPGSREEPQSLIPVLDRHEREIVFQYLSDENDPVRRAYEKFDCLDALLFPLELAGGLREKDRIEIVRISPADAQKGFSNLRFSDKVAGETFYHFGGFFKRSWRSNDILWGRLDGLCQLLETLLDRERLSGLLRNDKQREKIRDCFFDNSNPPQWNKALDPAVLFPASDSTTHDKCRRWLKDLFSNDTKKERASALGERFPVMVELIIEAAQLEAIREDFPWVIVDARMEQDEWNGAAERAEPKGGGAQGQAAAGKVRQESSKRSKAGDDYVDPLVSAFSSVEHVTEKLKEFGGADATAGRPSETGLGSFFRKGPQVGSETIAKNIPPLVLLEIVAKALLVARNCILNVFGKRADGIKRSRFYFYGLDLPLRLFYYLVCLANRGSKVGFALSVALVSVCILLWLLGIVFFKQIVWVESGSLFIRSMIFFVLPGAALVLVWLHSRYCRALRRRNG